MTTYRADSLFADFWQHVTHTGAWLTCGAFGLPMQARFVVDDFGWLHQVGPVSTVEVA